MLERPSFEFDFSISFAGEDRSLAKKIAQKLAAKGFSVFYDDSYRFRLLGKKLDREFRWIFGKGTRFFVPLVSRFYVEKPWPQLEWAIAKEEATQREGDFILPFRLDDSLLLGLSDNIGYLDLREIGLDQAVEILYMKYREDVDAEVEYLPAGRWVATFGLVIDELIESGQLPESAPLEYALLCDWLEADLMKRLQSASIYDPHMSEASHRDGEVLSIRVAFEWDPNQDPLGFGDLQWWEVLEVAPFSNIYETHGE